eukprot:GHVU01094205.1.p1 GENE.GHVU01094205.1~~GHVU01094205.1.p1  ORF type:complete len:127 (+),score=5.59 GHVU01094205.1:181-561(+)
MIACDEISSFNSSVELENGKPSRKLKLDGNAAHDIIREIGESEGLVVTDGNEGLAGPDSDPSMCAAVPVRDVETLEDSAEFDHNRSRSQTVGPRTSSASCDPNQSGRATSVPSGTQLINSRSSMIP